MARQNPKRQFQAVITVLALSSHPINLTMQNYDDGISWFAQDLSGLQHCPGDPFGQCPFSLSKVSWFGRKIRWNCPGFSTSPQDKLGCVVNIQLWCKPQPHTFSLLPKGLLRIKLLLYIYTHVKIDRTIRKMKGSKERAFYQNVENGRP